MTLGNELKKYIPVGKTQKTVALEMAEALKTVVGLQYSPDTAESRWSEALKGKLTGLRFFFESEPRMETSLAALGVPAAEMPRLRQLIRGALGGQTVLLDLTSASHLSPAVYAGLRAWLLSVESDLQVIVGLTDAQYDDAPASFRECGARFERSDLSKLRETAAVIVSEEQVRPIEKWLSVSFTAPPVFSPADWRERLMEGADLGALPKPTRPAMLIAEPGETSTDRLPRGPRLRELMLALATGADDPTLAEIYNGRALSSRLALGKVLGVDVSATQDEWDQKRFAGLTEIDPEALPLVLLASRLSGEKQQLRIGNKVHLVNPTSDMQKRMQSLMHSAEDIVVHEDRLDPDQYLRALREAASRLTQEQVFADPWLDAWIDDRFPALEDRLVACDALVWLSQSKQLKFTDSEPASDWRKSLSKLIAAIPSRATLLLSNTTSEYYFTPARQEASVSGRSLRPFAPMILSREAGLLSERQATDIPKSSFEWALQLRGRIAPRPTWQRNERGYSPPVKVAETVWETADELLAEVLDALAFNVTGAPARVTRDGWAHLLLGGGVVVRVQVRRNVSSDCSGSFRVFSGEHSTSALTERVVTHAAGWGPPNLTSFGPYVPVNMRLSGAGLVADLSFSASALFGGFMDPGVASAIAAND